MKTYFIITKNSADETISRIERHGDDAEIARERREAKKYNDYSSLHDHGEYRYVTTRRNAAYSDPVEIDAAC